MNWRKKMGFYLPLPTATLRFLVLIGFQSAFAQFDFLNFGHANMTGWGVSVAVSSNHAFVANASFGLEVYDITDPRNLVLIGASLDRADAGKVVLAGEHAYVAANNKAVVYNISDPANPLAVAEMPGHGWLVYDIAIAGDFAYVANSDYGIVVFNISNPTNPVPVCVVSNSASMQGIAASSNRVYAVAFGSGLYVVDTTDPTNSIIVGHAQIDNWNTAVAIQGNTAYVANAGSGLHVLDVSISTNPVSLFQTNQGGYAYGVAVSGNIAFLASGYGGLRAYEISDPTNVVALASVYEGGQAIGISVAKNLVFLANANDGLRSYHLAPELTIGRNTATTLQLSWPVSPVNDYQVQSTTDLSPPSWQAMTNDPAVIGNRNYTTDVFKVLPKYYRLISP